MILGQDQDHPGGGFELGQAFGGELFRLNVFSKKLRVEDVSAMYYDGRCSRLPSTLVHDVVISWEDFLAGIKSGDVKEVSAECDESSFLSKVSMLVIQELNSCRGR